MDDEQRERDADRAAAQGDILGARSLLADLVTRAPTFERLVKLSAMQRAGGNGADSLKTLDRALALRPLDPAALLMRATQLHTMGHIDDAAIAYGRAIAHAPDPLPAKLVPVLAVARQRYAAWQARQAERLRNAVQAAPTAVSSASMDRFITNAVRMTEADREGPTHYCYPGLPEIPFYDRGLFPWLSELEAATPVIRDELGKLLAAQEATQVPYVRYSDNLPLDQWAALNNSADWSALHLQERGKTMEANSRHCPMTMALLARLPQPQIKGAGSNAMFSLLVPHTHIPPHTGVSNTRLVCHLPLIVPDGCWFRVGSERREWREGEAWVFDDTIEHEAMNPTDDRRVVLIFDIWHPALSAQERDGVAAVIGAGEQVHGL
ncbi:MAG: aspartyl/asparaginyl beta-hydroxylase domain-containing protein [Sphingobium sp.]